MLRLSGAGTQPRHTRQAFALTEFILSTRWCGAARVQVQKPEWDVGSESSLPRLRQAADRAHGGHLLCRVRVTGMCSRTWYLYRVIHVPGI